MTKEEQLSIINDAIKKTKYNLKPLGYNLIFWSVVVISMSLFHYFFPQIVQYQLLFIYNLLGVNSTTGMVYTTYYNIKTGIKIGYETQLERVIRIIWAVYLDLLGCYYISYFLITSDINPVPDILFLLGRVLP